MPDRDKVIKGIEQCTIDYCSEEFETQCEDCPYYTDGITLEECRKELRDDFHALLKEQKKQRFLVNENGHITPLPVVVRCKDCKNYDTTDCFWKLETGNNKDPDWYCADGERK